MSVEQSIARAGASLLPLIGRRVYTAASRRRAADVAQATLLTTEHAHILDFLEEDQVTRLVDAVESAEFSNVMLQANIYAARGYKEDDAAGLREQIRGLMKHHGVAANDRLPEIVDVLVNEVVEAVESVRSIAMYDASLNPTTLRMISAVTAAGVRNSELMEQLKSVAEVNATAARVRRRTLQLYAQLELPTAVASRQVDWERLYVAPHLTLSQRTNTTGAESVSALVEQCLRLVAVGNPGAGKSTLTQRLALDLAGDINENLTGQVPVILIVRKYVESITKREQSILEYIQYTLRTQYAIRADESTIDYLLLNGRMALLVDGIDELGPTHLRSDFARRLNAFAYEYPTARIVATCRELAYDEAPLDAELFETATVRPFDEKQIRRYAKLWFTLAGKEQGSVRKFMDQTRSTPDLRSNPLLLSLLCVLYVRDRTLPRNRPEIYAACATLLFEKWDEERGINLAPELRAFIRLVVDESAWLIFNQPKGELSVPRQALLAHLASSVLAEKYTTPAEATRAAEDFLEFCAGRAWVLTEVGSGIKDTRYGFVHKTFLEFFAARHLVSLCDSAEQLWEHLAENIGSSAWEVAGPLAVQIFDQDRANGANRVLEQLLFGNVAPGGDVDGAAKTFARMTLFACDTLETAAPDNRYIEAIAHRCLDATLACPSRQRQGSAWSAQQADEAMTALLTVQLPENVVRIARFLVSALLDESRPLRDDIECALVYASLKRREDASSKPVVREIQRLFAELEVAPVFRMTDEFFSKPEPHHLQRLGAARLFYNVSIADWRLRGPGYALLRGVLSSSGPDQSALETLSSLVEDLERQGYSWAKDQPVAAATELGNLLVSPEKIRRLPRDARSASLLLLMPFAEHEARAHERRGDWESWGLGVPVPHSKRKLVPAQGRMGRVRVRSGGSGEKLNLSQYVTTQAIVLDQLTSRTLRPATHIILSEWLASSASRSRHPYD